MAPYCLKATWIELENELCVALAFINAEFGSSGIDKVDDC